MRNPPRISAVFALASLLACLCAQAAADAPKRSALVIGNGRYAGDSSLASPSADAKALSESLKALGFGVETLIDADLPAMSRAARAFLSESADAELRFFYFSGYAVQEDGGNWLVPAGSAASPSWSAKAEALSANSLASSLAAAGSGMSVFVIDGRGDNPFSAGTGAPGLAAMSADRAVIAFSAPPGATSELPGDSAPGPFAAAIASELANPGKSVQEAILAASERSGLPAGGARSPWVSSRATSLYYLSPPEAALQAILEKKAQAESAVKQLDGRVSDLKARIAAEKDADQRRTLEAELKAQSESLANERGRLESVKAGHQRLVATAEARVEEGAALALLEKEQASRLKSIDGLAELRHWEIESLVGSAASAENFLKAVEGAEASRADMAKRYRSALEVHAAAIEAAYDRRVKAVAAWASYPWESVEDFRLRAADERIRLTCEKQARSLAAVAGDAGVEQALLAPFDAAGAKARSGLESAKATYSGASIKVSVGAFDEKSSSYPVAISSAAGSLPYSATFDCSVAGATPDESRSRYLEFEAWRKSGAISGEVDASISIVPGSGYAIVVDRVRIRARTADGPRLLAEEAPLRPVARFKGSSDRERPIPVSSWISIIGTGTELSVNGGTAKRDRLFHLDPAAGSYVVRAVLDDGSAMERLVELKAGENALVEFRLGRFTIPWLALGSTVSARGKPKAAEGQAPSLFSTSDVVRDFTQKAEGPFRSPLLPEGFYRIAIGGDYRFSVQIEIPAYAEVELPGYADNLIKTMTARRASMEKSISGLGTKKKIGVITLSVGAVGAAGAIASYFLGAAAADDIRTATDTPTAEAAHKRYDVYSVIFPITAAIGGAGLGASPFFLLFGPNEDKVKKSIESLDLQIKALAK